MKIFVRFALLLGLALSASACVVEPAYGPGYYGGPAYYGGGYYHGYYGHPYYHDHYWR